MKIISLIIFSFSFILFFITSSTQSHASHAPATSRMASRFMHNDGSTEWEVAYKFLFTNGVGERASTPTTWFKLTNVVSPFLSFDWSSQATPYIDFGPSEDKHPAYRIQWGTTCIDPRDNPVLTVQNPDINLDVYLFYVDVTLAGSAGDNSGRTISYAYGSDISNRTDLCPFGGNPPPPPPPPKPDLVVSAFNFQGGSTCGTSDPRVVIKNIGNAGVTGNFNVRVFNGAGAAEVRTVTQTVSVGEEIDLSRFFTNMPRPPAGTYTAVATVDSNDDINESNGGNNQRSDTYTTTPLIDLSWDEFVYPGGNTAGTSNPTVKIKNSGNARITGDFGVRVFNGAADTRFHRVSIGIDPNQVVNLSSFFTGMGLPPAGNHTATATVDWADEINECLEGNNQRQDAYTTSSTPLPDLDITQFTYLGGIPGATTNPTLTIRNNSDVAITADFKVKVFNGGFGTREIPVTTNLAGRATLNLNTDFAGMPLPAAGTYTAVATVDSASPDDVTESNEGNNQRSYNYVTANPSRYNISGIVYVDSNNDGVIQTGSDARFTGVGTLTTSPGGRTDESDATTGGYSITNNPNGTYTVTLSNVASNYQIVIGSRTPTVNGANVTGVNFLVRQTSPPTTWNISGRIFVDDNGCSGLQTTSVTCAATGLTVPADSTYVAHFDGGIPNITVSATNQSTGARSTDTTLTGTSSPNPSQYSVIGLPNGTYTMAISNLESGYFPPPPRSVVVNGANRTGVNFLLTLAAPPPPPPPVGTYSISGGVFDDSEAPGQPGSGSKSGSEVYTALGTVSLDGGPATTPPGGVFNFANLSAGSHSVRFFPPSSGYQVTFPSISPYTVNVTLGSPCVDGGGDSTCSGGDIINLNFGLYQAPTAAWYQSIGGDVRFDQTNYTNIIPEGDDNVCTTNPPQDPTQPYLSAESLAPITNSLSSGVVFTGSNPQFRESGGNPSDKASTNRWLVTGNAFTPARPGTIKTSFDLVDGIVRRSGGGVKPMFSNDSVIDDDNQRACTETSGTCQLKSGLTHGTYKTAQSVTLLGSGTPASYTFPVAGDYVFLIDNNLRIDSNITTPPGSSVLFIVSGDITVGPNVSSLEGIFSANGNITIEGEGGGADSPLIIEGNIIANAGLSGKTINMERNLGALNAQCPAFRVIFRPDFILNSPEFIRSSNYSVQEVAPRGNLPSGGGGEEEEEPTPIPTPIPPTFGNLLKNGSFEVDANSDGKPDDWGTNAKFTRSNEQAQDGTYSGKFFISDIPGAGATIPQTVKNLTAGTKYNVGAFVNIPNAAAGFSLDLEVIWKDSSGNPIGTPFIFKTYTAQTTNWDRATATLTAPALTNKANVTMVVKKLTGTIYVDNFSFTR